MLSDVIFRSISLTLIINYFLNLQLSQFNVPSVNDCQTKRALHKDFKRFRNQF